uniref:UTP--glucose-1-phosphate uridylyltransferase n=1 Tax=Caenorhabditis japonica TaxID=281687 RepID=A0A8R1DY65_CAEJA
MESLTNEHLKKKIDEFFQRQKDQSEIALKDAEIFKDLYKQFLEHQHHIDWNSWKYIKEESQVTLENIQQLDLTRTDIGNKLVVIKLNGGLGTTMGCKKAKSLVEVIDGYSFLDLAVLEHEKMCNTFGVKTPLYLMNSFYTDEDTKEHISKKQYTNVRTFLQSKCPRLDAETKLPIEDDEWKEDAWCPPGHGNIFQSLENSGLLDELISEGREIVFVSNIDNTGALVSLPIAQMMLEKRVDYVMECTDKTKVDIKGGTLIEINNQMMHLEMPQVPIEHLKDFCSTEVFKIFNTNNIWFNLNAVKRLLPNIRSEIIVNKKNVRGRDVLQLEFSIGGCIKNFPNALCVHVQRPRFRPVKNLGDFLSLRSFFADPENVSDKLGSTPIVSLDSSVYTNVEEVVKRFPYPLDMKKCTEFKVVGDVFFGKDVRLHGNVTIENKTREPVHIPDGSSFEDENKIIL